MSVSPSSPASELSLYSCTAAASAEAGMSLWEVVPQHTDYNMSKIIVSQVLQNKGKYFTAHSCTNVAEAVWQYHGHGYNQQNLSENLSVKSRLLVFISKEGSGNPNSGQPLTV